MRIGLDLTHCFQRNSGFQRYAINLARTLISINSDDEFVLFFRQEIPGELLDCPYECRVIPPHHQFFSEQITLLDQINKSKLDLFHSTGFAGPVFYTGKKIHTVHDASVFIFPESMKSFQKLYWKYLLKLSLQTSIGVLTVSNSSKDGISKYYGIPHSKIDVIHLAADQDFTMILEDERLQNTRKMLGIPEKFFLMVSTLEPRKNHLRAIQAFSRYQIDHPEYSLVLVGRRGWLFEPIFTEICNLGIQKKVVFLDNITNQQLVDLYNLAKLLVYPSIYEGFGFPILEAMACGCLVLTSNVSSMPEIAGDAAIYVDPYSVDSIFHGMVEAMSSNSKRLVNSGLQRAKEFSWNKVAQQTQQAYHVAIVRS